MRVKDYKQLFCISADEYDKYGDDIHDDFVFQGSKNWDFYFEKKIECDDLDIFTNVKLLNFEDRESFEKFLTKNKIIDYSLEHKLKDNYLVLVDG